jgi:uncharacterized membrane protein YvbJ
MALISCPECKAQVSDQAGSCPQCGYPMKAPQIAPKQLHPDLVDPRETQGKSHPVLWTLGILCGLFVAFMAYGFMVSNTPEGRAQAKDRDAIALCHKEQNDELQERSTRRFVRRVCDNMVAYFTAKYGVDP